MKKLVLLLAVVFSVSLFSCGNKAAEAAANDEATEVVATEETVVAETPCCKNDSCKNDSCKGEGTCADCTEDVAAEATEVAK